MISNSSTPSSGIATRNTSASFALIVKETIVAVSIIVGARNAGRIPFETEFWIVVTSLVRRVTSDGVLNRSMFPKEKPCIRRYSALRSSAPSP